MIRVRVVGALVFIFLVLTPVFSQTNGHIGFTLYIDNVSPVFDYFEGISVIMSVNDVFHTYCHWTDNVNLNEFVFEWDESGVLVNDSAQSFVDGWSNVSKTFTSIDEGKIINYRIHGSDGWLNWNSTYYKSIVVASIKPENSFLDQGNGSPLIGDLVNISSYWLDNFEVDHVVLETNESGSWLVNGSPVDIDVSEGWANFSIDTTGFNSSPYYWRLTGFDEVGNSNTTPINFFTPQ